MNRIQTSLAVSALCAQAASLATGRWSHIDPTVLPLNLLLSNRLIQNRVIKEK